MILWMTWIAIVWQLQIAFSNKVTFLWAVVAIMGFCVRPDLAGVTSLVRGLDFLPCCYDGLLRLFHSNAVDLSLLRATWSRVCWRSFAPYTVSENGRAIIMVDGIKNAKEGRKMPAVKSLHQESNNNSKPEYIMGHSVQVAALLVESVRSWFAVPLTAAIHEGVVFSNRDKRTLIDKLMGLVNELKLDFGYYIVADAFYACGKVAERLLAEGNHLVTRVKSDAVAFEPPAQLEKRRRGRPRKYGDKIKLKSVFKLKERFVTMLSPLYDDCNLEILVYSQDLIWRPLGELVRFVFVIHPTRGSRVLMSTDLSLEPLQIIRIYGWRFKIEVSFKEAIHTVGTYAYHFWMKGMDEIKRHGGDQFLHRKSQEYRDSVRRKIRAYEFHMQLGLIAQGVLQYLAIARFREVWQNFGSWLRTMRTQMSPSEAVTSSALQNTLPEFLLSLPQTDSLMKFLEKKVNWDRLHRHSRAA